MRHLVPGCTTSSIGGLFSEVSQQVITESAEIASMLTAYWQKIFDEKKIDADLLVPWLSRIPTPLPFSGSVEEYLPALANVREAISESTDSAPGLPARVWKALCKLAAPILHRVICEMLRTSPKELRKKGPHSNEVFLSCLGKKRLFTEQCGHVFAPSGTRPISIVNSDNRILANAWRSKLSPIIDPWITIRSNIC